MIMDKTWILISVGMGMLWAISCWFMFRHMAIQTIEDAPYRVVLMSFVGGLIGVIMGFITAVVCGVVNV